MEIGFKLNFYKINVELARETSGAVKKHLQELVQCSTLFFSNNLSGGRDNPFIKSVDSKEILKGFKCLEILRY